MPSVFLTAEWRHLAMLNYAVDPALLEAFVPPGTKLDFFEGKAFVSLVGFRFLNTRVLGFPVPFHRNFDEVNLRFYVRRDAFRGVVFIREIVPKRAVATLARLAYNENYIALPMTHRIEPSRVTYGWRSGSDSCSFTLEAVGTPTLPPEGSEEQFIAEHYWGYTAQRDGSTIEYQVTHEPWLVRRAASAILHGDSRSLYGKDFSEILQRAPDSAFLAEGSAVEVLRGTRIALPKRIRMAS